MNNNDSTEAPKTVGGAELEAILARANGINPDTGLPIGLKAVSKPPKKKCKKCYGRGHIGYIDGDKSQPYPCMCTIEIVLDEPEPFKEKTVTEPVGNGPIPVEPNVTSNALPSDCTAMGDPKPESSELI